MHPYSNHFGKALRTARKTAGYQQQELAAHLQISIPYLCDIEYGRRAPLETAMIAKAARFLRVDVQDLLIAASQSRGHFELKTELSVHHDAVGRALMRAWKSLSAQQLTALAKLLTKEKTK